MPVACSLLASRVCSHGFGFECCSYVWEALNDEDPVVASVQGLGDLLHVAHMLFVSNDELR
jgi:hypothetical protein